MRERIIYHIIPAWIFGGLALFLILALTWAGLWVAGLHITLSPVWWVESLIVWAIGSLLGVVYAVVFA